MVRFRRLSPAAKLLDIFTLIEATSSRNGVVGARVSGAEGCETLSIADLRRAAELIQQADTHCDNAWRRALEGTPSGIEAAWQEICAVERWMGAPTNLEWPLMKGACQYVLDADAAVATLRPLAQRGEPDAITLSALQLLMGLARGHKQADEYERWRATLVATFRGTAWADMYDKSPRNSLGKKEERE